MNFPIKIGIDTRDLKLATTGTKTYLAELLKALNQKNGLDYNLIEFQSIWPPYWGKNILGKIFEHVSFFIWKQVTLPIKTLLTGVDVLICTDYYLPLLKFKAKHMVVFHDALFFDHPEYYNPLWLKWFKLVAVNAALKADKIIVPSEFSLNRLHIFLPELKDKMQVIYQGPKSTNKESNVSEATKIALNKIGKSPFLLHVGGLEKRKNLSFLIKVLAEVRKKIDLKLLLVGRANPKIYNNSYNDIIKTIESTSLEKEVIFTGYVPDEDLPSIYEKASAYIIPSIYEGFGIPILEAFQYKIPVAVANNSCLPEIGGDAVLTFSPYNEQELLALLLELLNNDDLRIELIEKGTNRLNHFNWDESAQKFVATALRLYMLKSTN